MTCSRISLSSSTKATLALAVEVSTPRILIFTSASTQRRFQNWHSGLKVYELKKRPISLLVFAEGTRIDDDVIKPFKHGSMNVCQRTGMSVVPLAIMGSRDIHRARIFRVNSGVVHVSIGRPIPADEVARHTTAELARRTRDEVVRLYEDAFDKRK